MGDGGPDLLVMVTLPLGCQAPPFPMWEQMQRDGRRRLFSVTHSTDEGMLCGQWHISSGAGNHIQLGKTFLTLPKTKHHQRLLLISTVFNFARTFCANLEHRQMSFDVQACCDHLCLRDQLDLSSSTTFT